jgi:mono/diheme cytochrome c family protein
MELRHFLPKKMTAVPLFIIMLIGVSAFRLIEKKESKSYAGTALTGKDSLASVQAFQEVYKVLMSPRCMNCHPAGDIPLQGDDSHVHQMAPKRGKDGKGVFSMKCANCHQPTNAPGLYAPPGNPKWALPPADMKMVFEGKSARELALQIMDFKRNGHKTKEMLIEHAHDTLVKAGWNMGEGRKQPPLSYEAFVNAWDTWIETGGYAPGR